MNNNQNPWYGINPQYLSELALCPSIGLAGCSNTMEAYGDSSRCQNCVANAQEAGKCAWNLFKDAKENCGCCSVCGC